MEARDLLLDSFYRHIPFNPYEKPYEYAKLIEGESYKILWANKGLFLKEQAKECFKFFVQPLRGYTAYQLGSYVYTKPVTYITLVLQVIELMILYACIGWYLFLVLRRRRKAHVYIVFLLVLLLVFCQFNPMPYTDARMRFPFDGWIIMAGVYALYMIRQKKHAPGMS